MQDEKSKNTARATLTQYLETKGCRKTPERYAILDMIYSMSKHFDVDSLYELMSHTEYRVSKATVYNTIDLLLEAGLVRKHQFGNAQAQYERASDMANHQHLICTTCGKVQEFNDTDIQEILTRKKFRQFVPSYHTLYVYGKCSKCVQAERRKNRKP